MATTSALFVGYFALTLPIIVLLVAFPFSTFLNFCLLPVISLVALPMTIQYAAAKYTDIKLAGVDQAFTLKLATALFFCSLASSSRFLVVHHE